jgi:hypothetical protein
MPEFYFFIWHYSSIIKRLNSIHSHGFMRRFLSERHCIDMGPILNGLEAMGIQNITGSLWRRQSQQSFNTLTPFYFIFYSLHVTTPTGHPQVRYIISYLKDYFNTTDPLHVCNLIIGMLFVAYVQWIRCIKIVLQITNCISHLRMAHRGRNM